MGFDKIGSALITPIKGGYGETPFRIWEKRCGIHFGLILHLKNNNRLYSMGHLF